MRFNEEASVILSGKDSYELTLDFQSDLTGQYYTNSLDV